MLFHGILGALASVALVAALPGNHRRQDTTTVTTTAAVTTTATETATTTAVVTTTSSTDSSTSVTDSVTTIVTTTASSTSPTESSTPPASSSVTTAVPVSSTQSSSTESSTTLTGSVISVTTTSVSSVPVTPSITTVTTGTPVSSTVTTEISTSVTSVVTATSSATTTVPISVTSSVSGSSSISSSASSASATSTSASGASSSSTSGSSSASSVVSSSTTGTESSSSSLQTTVTTTVPVSSTVSVSGTLTTTIPIVPSSSANVTSSPTPTIITSSSVSVSGTLTTTVPVVITSSAGTSETPSTSGSVSVSGSFTTTIPVVITTLPASSGPSTTASPTATTISGITGSGTSLPGPTVSASAAPSPTPVPRPSGGIGFDTTPQYKPLSNFDFQSLNLVLQQEIIELNLFQFGVTRFNLSDFQAAGLTEDDITLIDFMASQEVEHATLIENILFPNVSQPCNYTFPEFTDVRSFIDFSQKITRLGESGVYGFLGHLDAQDAATLLIQTVATEARQQSIFRQMEGIFPFTTAFVPAITQSMHWTLMAPLISGCPVGNPNIEWTNYPALTILDNPYWPDIPLDNTTSPAIARNRTNVSYPGREVYLSWETPGLQVGPNKSFTTTTKAGPAQFAAWISELNITYTELTNIQGTNATTTQPGGFVFPGGAFPLVNDTIFVLLTDAAPFVTPYNLSQIESHIVAGPAFYQAG